MALSKGNPFEWNDTKQSQTGHSSTGFLKIKKHQLIFKQFTRQEMQKQYMQNDNGPLQIITVVI